MTMTSSDTLAAVTAEDADRYPVLLVSTDTRDWVFQYDGVKYNVPAGSDRTMCPYIAAQAWFGNPLLQDKPGGSPSEQKRTKEHHRLRVRYGIYDSLIDPETGVAANGMAFPKIRVTTLDGDEIPMVAYDRDGEAGAAPDMNKVLSENRIAVLERQLAELKMLVQTATGETPDDVPTPEPVRTRESRTATPDGPTTIPGQ